KYNTIEMEKVVDLRTNAPKYAVLAEAVNANDRGLIITHHHRCPLGSNLSDWNVFWKREGKIAPRLSVTNIEALKEFWRYHVEAQQRAGFENVWTIVFRGSRDVPFWETFKDAPSSKVERANVINQMLQTEADIDKDVKGKQ